MKRGELVAGLRRLQNVGFGYDLTEKDKELLRQAADEIDDLGAFSEFAREKAREIVGDPK